MEYAPSKKVLRGPYERWPNEMEHLYLCLTCRALTRASLLHSPQEQYRAYFAINDTENIAASDLRVQDLLRHQKVDSITSHGHGDSRNVILYHADRIDATSQQGCRICTSLAAMLRAKVLEGDQHKDAGTYIGAEVIVPSFIDYDYVNFAYINFHLLQNRDIGPPFTQHLGSLLVRSQLPAQSGEPTESSTRYRQALQPSTQVQLRCWIHACQFGEHALCNERKERSTEHFDVLPSRVLELATQSAQTTVRLRDTSALVSSMKNAADPPLPYVTLSHCWGKKGISCSLRKSVLTQYQAGIPVNNLPKTFQDAISVTLALGYQYLWIDALCIIQDDNLDWVAEAPRMIHIYSNSVVTLAATASNSPDDGFFLQDGCLNPFVTTAQWSGSGGPVAITITPTLEHLEHSPLNQRAWVYQEQLLSNRTIHFAADQVWWSCNEAIHGEIDRENTLPETNNIYSLQVAFSDWRDMVEIYSKRSLTYSTDRLVALAGVAQAYSNFHGYHTKPVYTYLAGLWRGPDFEAQLLWNVTPVPQQDTLNNGERPDYIAPSWSWASVNCEVQFPYVLPDAEWHPSWLIASAAVQTADKSNQFSPCISGTLTVRSVMRRVSLKKPSSDYPPTVFMLSTKASTVDVQCDAHIDQAISKMQDDHEGDGFGAIFMSMVKNQEDVTGLLVKPTPDAVGVYTRIGTMTVKSYNSDLETTKTHVEAIWNTGDVDLHESHYLKKFDDGVYEIKLI